MLEQGLPVGGRNRLQSSSELAFERIVLLLELHLDIGIFGRELLERLFFIDQVGRAGSKQHVAGLDHGADHQWNILRPVMLDRRIRAAAGGSSALETNRPTNFS